MSGITTKDRIRGSLFGGAIGDALGYAIEFWSEDRIFSRYGVGGIQDYELIDGIAEISDDTQMSLFTANGLLFGDTLTTMGRVNRSPDGSGP